MDIRKIYKHIDYTLLKPTATYNDIWNLCEDAVENDCASVCIPSHFVEFAHNHFPNLTICTVIGFPFGNSTTETKVFEAKKATKDGAKEIDMVINIGEMKNGNYWYIKNEIERVVDAVPYETIVKVIIETCYLTDIEIGIATKIVDKSNADYVKTSTGYGTRGASFSDIEIMKSMIWNRTFIKASGGIRTAEDMEKYIEMGCDRIGASVLP